MKNLKKIKWFYRLTILSFLLLSSVSVSYAIGTVNTGYRANKTATTMVDAHGECRNIDNTSSYDYFVPTNTASEWASFRAPADADSLSGVSLSSCAIPCTSGSQIFSTPGIYSLTVDVNKESCRFRFTVKAGGGQSGGWGHQGGWGGAVQFDYSPNTTGTFNIFVGSKGQSNSISAYTGGTGYGGGGGASAVKFGNTVLVVSGGGGGAAWGGRGGNGGSLNSGGAQAGGSSPGGGGANNIGGIGRPAGGGYGGRNGVSGANG